MRYTKIIDCDQVNSVKGVSVSLWTQGCPHRCDGCFNQSTWDFEGGTEYTEKTKTKILKKVSSDYVNGLSILGGEPFSPNNRNKVLDLIKTVKKVYPKKTIMVWTGYTVEELNFLKDTPIDYIIDGKFDKKLASNNLNLRGSSNQRIFHCGKDVTNELGFKK